MSVETLEVRQTFSVAPLDLEPIAPAPRTLRSLGDQAVLLVPTGESPVHFFFDSRDSAADDELGYFFVDGPDGRITKRVDDDPDGEPLLSDAGLPQYVRPGDADYADYALAAANSVAVFTPGEVLNHGRADKVLDVLGDHFVAFYLIADASSETWREAEPEDRPHAWFSTRRANVDGLEHFQLTNRLDAGYRRDVRQYKVEDSRMLPSRMAGARADFNDAVFSVNIVPFATGDDYSVFNSGVDFDGAPQGFKLDTPDDRQNRGLGLLWNDRSFRRQSLQVVGVRIDEEADWIPVVDRTARRGKLTLTDPALHGSITVFPNGGFQFDPDVNDEYWYPTDADAEPEPVYFQYLASDGLDSYDAWVSVSHGYYHEGGASDDVQAGQRMYLLAGGGDTDQFGEAATKFFTDGSNRGDIVLIGQGVELKDWATQVYDEFAQGQARSVTSLSITTRDQANDPRIVELLKGADALWFGGGAQSYYQNIWRGTQTFASIAAAAAGNVAIGGTSAGMAILGQYAYVDFPWDSVKSRFATQQPLDPRVNMELQGRTTLPFAALSSSTSAPLYGMVTDTHFAVRDRMGRLAAFVTKPRGPALYGLAAEVSTAVLIQPAGDDWLWSVFGEGAVYFVDPGTGANDARYVDGGRLSYGPVGVHKLAATGFPGGQMLSVLKGAVPSYQFQVSAGTIFTTQNGGSLY